MERTVELYSEEDARGGTRQVWLRLTDDGTLILEGQDLGGAVGLAFRGSSEYEWGWALAPDRVGELLGKLDVPADSPDLLNAVGQQVMNLERDDIQNEFREAGAEFWSRHGD
jgi:hypothetical protein